MNYSVADLRNRHIHTTKATLQRQGMTLDLVVKPGESPSSAMIEYADNVTYLDENGAEIAKTKALDGKTWDNRGTAVLD